ncbi:hypothetical protein B296_00019600 [Ensete ventricosum]|uniref:Uncharacterized protein n=1 Tax=Ensete ventricosum TaxID=4639 RepID=A0A427AV87_ENSVE|nr:hypothetical protein B296_00019600 [Ensete ventricosum]
MQKEKETKLQNCHRRHLSRPSRSFKRNGHHPRQPPRPPPTSSCSSPRNVSKLEIRSRSPSSNDAELSSPVPASAAPALRFLGGTAAVSPPAAAAVSGKLSFALFPRISSAATSYARAASSAVPYVPSHTLAPFLGSLISAAHFPHGRLRIPLYDVFRRLSPSPAALVFVSSPSSPATKDQHCTVRSRSSSNRAKRGALP